MLIGKTLKVIRENKGLSQHAFSKGIVTPSYYSKVEADLSHISADLLFEILEASNVTIQEFYYIKKNYNNESQVSIIRQIRLYFNCGDFFALESLYKELLEEKVDSHYLLLIKSLINYLKGNQIEPSNLKKLKEHLLNIPSWGHYEFQLFSLCSYLFEVETLILLSSNIIRNIDKYEEFPNYEQDLLITLINLVRSFVRSNKIKDAHYFLQLAKSVHKNPLLIYEKLLIDFFDYLLELDVNKLENELKARYIICLFQNLDLHYIAEKLDCFFQERLSKVL